MPYLPAAEFAMREVGQTPLFMIREGEDDLGLSRFKKTVWDTYSTQLSDAVTQINQQVQLIQNEVSEATTQKNRHFDLGDNALTKMYDMIGKITGF